MKSSFYLISMSISCGDLVATHISDSPIKTEQDCVIEQRTYSLRPQWQVCLEKGVISDYRPVWWRPAGKDGSLLSDLIIQHVLQK